MLYFLVESFDIRSDGAGIIVEVPCEFVHKVSKWYLDQPTAFKNITETYALMVMYVNIEFSIV